MDFRQKPLVIVVVWASLLLGLFVAMGQYAFSPGLSAAAPVIWPSETKLSREKNRFNLVIFIHPSCSCSAATITEMKKIVAETAGLVSTHVLISKSDGKSETESNHVIGEISTKIPSVTIVLDHDGREASAFGVQTSGQVLLYSAEGKLLFNGGITSSRGHEGDNEAENAVISLILSKSNTLPNSPVFGCHLNKEAFLVKATHLVNT